MVRWIFPHIYGSRIPTMPCPTGLDIPAQEPAQMLAALRRARDGSLLARHVFL